MYTKKELNQILKFIDEGDPSYFESGLVSTDIVNLIEELLFCKHKIQRLNKKISKLKGVK